MKFAHVVCAKLHSIGKYIALKTYNFASYISISYYTRSVDEHKKCSTSILASMLLVLSIGFRNVGNLETCASQVVRKWNCDGEFIHSRIGARETDRRTPNLLFASCSSTRFASKYIFRNFFTQSKSNTVLESETFFL